MRNNKPELAVPKYAMNAEVVTISPRLRAHLQSRRRSLEPQQAEELHPPGCSSTRQIHHCGRQTRLITRAPVIPIFEIGYASDHRWSVQDVTRSDWVGIPKS